MGLVLLEGVRDLVAEVLMQFFQLCSDLVSRIQHNSFERNFEFGVKALVGKEGGDCGHRMQGIVVCKLYQGKEVDQVILLTVNVPPKVLFQYSVNMFSLTVSLMVVGH